MKALLSRTSGGPETLTLEDVPTPVPGKGQVLVRVAAVGINYPDVLIIEDKYQFKPERPFSPGAELSGTVTALGEDVTELNVGDRILAMTGWGALAQEVAVDATRCVHIPDAMPFDEAAAFIMTYGTSFHALQDRAGLQAGETLLVLGASGGVGLAAVELAKAMGARVIAATSSEEKLAVAVQSGADGGLVYPKGPLDRDAQKVLAEAIKTACGKDGANVVYDPVGGDYFEPALRAIAWEGRYLVVGFPAGIPKIAQNLVLLKGCDIRGVFWGAAVTRNPVRHRQAVTDLFALYGEGKIRPTISERFPLERAGDAIAALAARRSTGKLVVTVS